MAERLKWGRVSEVGTKSGRAEAMVERNGYSEGVVLECCIHETKPLTIW